jgi:transposase
MMGSQPPPQGNLFYYGISLEKRVRQNHPLRRIEKLIDFDFIYAEVKDKYGYNGNVSVPPPVILKLMLLLVSYNVRSERELMQTVPERLDWLWFLGYDLDSEAPDHSVLSKARKRWGVEAFREFFEQIVWQCVEAGLVDGSKVFVDSSLIEADASNNSVVDTQSLKRYLNKSYRELERRLEDIQPEKAGEVNKRYISTTDPEASIVRCGAKPKLCYKTHRVVDPKAEVITATEVTPGEVNEAHRLTSLLDSHHEDTGKKANVVVADSKYGTVDNFIACHDRGVRAHIPDLRSSQEKRAQRRGIFPAESFIYDKGTDIYLCPAGKQLSPRTLHKNRQSIDYAAKKSDCAECELKQKCTKNKSGRTLKRHLNQEALDYMRAVAKTRVAKKDIKTRQH